MSETICDCGKEKSWDSPGCEDCLKKEKTMGDIVEREETSLEGNSPADMIRLAVQGGADLDKLEKLLALQERFEANEARKAFAKSFSLAQEKISGVVKTKTNPQTHSKYAALEDIIESAKPIYTQFGFSVIFYEGDTPQPEHIRIFADVLHCAGHKETYHYDVPLDGVGIKGNANMTKIHAKASSTSYGRRYLMCMIWNIPTQDDDAQTSVVFVDNKQLNALRDLLIASESDEKKFIDWLKVETLEMLPATDYAKAESALKAKIEKKKADSK